MKHIIDWILHQIVNIFDWCHVKVTIKGLNRRGVVGKMCAWIGRQSFIVALRLQKFRILHTMKDE